MARPTPNSSPTRLIIGTRPDVDRVMRRLRALILGVHDDPDRLVPQRQNYTKARPCPSSQHWRAAAHPPGMATQRKCRALPSFVRQSLRRSSLRTIRWVPVWQKEQVSAADLTRNAKAPRDLPPGYRPTHLITVPGPQEPFAGTIRRELFGDRGRALDDEGRRQFLLKRSR